MYADIHGDVVNIQSLGHVVVNKSLTIISVFVISYKVEL